MRRATAGDAERIAEIYNWYILHTIITFETDVISPQEMAKRIQKNLINHDSLGSLTCASRPTAARGRFLLNTKRHIWAAAAEAER
jgi:L-amino acid N-acyltransferase YncA